MKKAILVLVLVSMAVFTANTARADAVSYAISWDNIFNSFVVVTSDAGGLTGVTATVGNDTAVGQATLNGSGSSSSANGTGPVGPVNTSLGTPTQLVTDFSQIGIQPTDYSVGSAQITSVQTIGCSSLPCSGPAIQANNKAESNVTAPPAAFATAGGNNSSASLVAFNIQLTAGGTIEFIGSAAPYLEVFLSPDALFGSKAEADLSVSISLKNLAGVTIFSWAPDGAVGGITGGSEISDPIGASLNTSLTQLIPGHSIYAPFGNSVGNLSPGSFGTYAAITNHLDPGLYTLTLAMTENTVVNVDAVPEPGTLLLLGAGLISLVVIRRRKQ